MDAERLAEHLFAQPDVNQEVRDRSDEGRVQSGDSRVPTPAFQLDLLGAPALRCGEGPVALSPSATLVCAYLALAPTEGRSRSLAAAQLFADCTEQNARRRLSTALWRLRTEVRSCTGVEIVATTGARTVALSAAADLTTDASRFTELVDPVLRRRPDGLTEEDASHLEAAVALHRGQLMEPCHDEWVLVERYRIENLFLNSLDYLLQFHGTRGDTAAVTRYGELALELEPLREDIHRHLIFAYGAAGRDDLVERQFERCRLLLLEQLGTDPMPETFAAYSQLRQGGSKSRPASDLGALISELERVRRDVERLATSVDRVLWRLRELS